MRRSKSTSLSRVRVRTDDFDGCSCSRWWRSRRPSDDSGGGYRRQSRESRRPSWYVMMIRSGGLFLFRLFLRVKISVSQKLILLEDGNLSCFVSNHREREALFAVKIYTYPLENYWRRKKNKECERRRAVFHFWRPPRPRPRPRRLKDLKGGDY